jgi:hypothetical protein
MTTKSELAAKSSLYSTVAQQYLKASKNGSDGAKVRAALKHLKKEVETCEELEKLQAPVMNYEAAKVGR